MPETDFPSFNLNEMERLAHDVEAQLLVLNDALKIIATQSQQIDAHDKFIANLEEKLTNTLALETESKQRDAMQCKRIQALERKVVELEKRVKSQKQANALQWKSIDILQRERFLAYAGQRLVQELDLAETWAQFEGENVTTGAMLQVFEERRIAIEENGTAIQQERASHWTGLRRDSLRWLLDSLTLPPNIESQEIDQEYMERWAESIMILPDSSVEGNILEDIYQAVYQGDPSEVYSQREL